MAHKVGLIGEKTEEINIKRRVVAKERIAISKIG